MRHLHRGHALSVDRVKVAHLHGHGSKRLRSPQVESHLSEGPPRAHLLKPSRPRCSGDLRKAQRFFFGHGSIDRSIEGKVNEESVDFFLFFF